MLFPYVGDPRECTGDIAFLPFFWPQEGKGEALGSVFVPLCSGSLRMQGCRSISALFWAPREGKGEPTTYDFVPLCWGSSRMQR